MGGYRNLREGCPLKHLPCITVAMAMLLVFCVCFFLVSFFSFAFLFFDLANEGSCM